MHWAKPSILSFLLAAGALVGRAQSSGELPGWLARAKSLGSRSAGNLTIVPILAKAQGALPRLSALDEALASGKLVVTETSASGTVNTLVLRNTSHRTVFVMAGEILAGAKQDRILQQDVLIPPHSEPVKVAAFCVEHGRWVAKSSAFYTEQKSAPLGVRQRAMERQEQGAVWAEVAANNASLGAASSTDTLSASFDAPKLKEKRGSYTAAFASLAAQFPQATGAVVLVNGRVMAADLFGDRALFEHLWAKLLDSYIAEAVRRQEESVVSPFTSAEAFLSRAREGRTELAGGIGTGFQVTLEAPSLKGSGVALGSPVHLGLFPTGALPPKGGLIRNYSHH